MNLLLSENVPLRTTRALGDFAESTPLPQRFGDLTQAPFKLIRLSDTKFLAADHPMEVTGAFVNKAATLGYAASLESDEDGNTWTVVEFDSAIPDSDEASAVGRGRRNPKTGALIENPADIMEFILRLCGRSETFGRLRAEAAGAGLVLAGSVTEIKSIRATLDDIAYSAGAIWTPLGARLYPTIDVTPPVTSLTRMNAENVTADIDVQDTADILHLSYAFSDALNKPLKSAEFTASPQLYGGVVQEVTLPWIHSPRVAEAVGRRWLHRLAGDRRAVTFSSGEIGLRPGDWTELVDHPEWGIPGADPQIMVLAVDLNADSSSVQITGEAVLSTPLIRLTAHSLALPPTLGSGIELTLTAGTAEFQILDDNDNPVKNARASFDGGPAQYSDAAGFVRFPVVRSTPPKAHILRVEIEGKTPFEIQPLI